jgi:MFS transporter, BCD family, chlorophyll transporter
MGIWGAAQAIAFGLGGFLGAVGVDAMRAIMSDTGSAFFVVFAIEALLFVGAAVLAGRLSVASKSVRSEVLSAGATS